MHREDFPQISDDFVYFDNAATTMKPACVLAAMQDFYEKQNANPRRGFYDLSLKATELLESARANIADYIGAKKDEVFFVSGATAGLNMLAISLGRDLNSNTEIAISRAEHHSNMLPWRKTKAKIKYFDPFTEPHFSVDTKIVAVSAFSNVLGPIPRLERIIAEAHRVGAICVIDATQAIAHLSLDFHALDADFLVFSGHKIYGPMGIGVVCGKKKHLAALPPAFWGGEMVDSVAESGEILADAPARFEAGTVNVAGAVGLSAAINYLRTTRPFEYETELSTYLYSQISKMDFVELLSKTPSTILSFNLRNIHPHDVAQLLADRNICVRAGFHCAQLAASKPSVRVSMSFYNTKTEIDRFLTALEKIREKMRVR